MMAVVLRDSNILADRTMAAGQQDSHTPTLRNSDIPAGRITVTNLLCSDILTNYIMVVDLLGSGIAAVRIMVVDLLGSGIAAVRTMIADLFYSSAVVQAAI